MIWKGISKLVTTIKELKTNPTLSITSIQKREITIIKGEKTLHKLVYTQYQTLNLHNHIN